MTQAAPNQAAEASGSRPEARTARPRLAHMPALDGLRGAAVFAVLLYHGDYLTGGYLGVDLFFVLSGFLITGLLLEEERRSETIDLLRFWIRRARRLLPALFLMLLGVAVFAAVWARDADLDQIRKGGFSALFYVSNWYEISRGTSYWDLSLAPSPVAHLWSLAVEEQFYLVWPIVVVLALRGRRGSEGARRLLPVAAIGAAGSAALALGLYAAGASVTLLYEATFTRAVGFLLGGVLACLRLAASSAAEARSAEDRGADDLGAGADVDVDVDADVGAGRSRSRRRARLAAPATARSEAFGLAAAVGLGLLWFGMEGASPWPYRGGLVLASVLGVLVVAGASAEGSPVLGRALSVRPLCRLGLISYGVYLWHWPVFLVVTEVRTGLSGVVLFAVRLAITLGIALLSYELVERPIRAGRYLTGPSGAVSVPAAVVLIGCSLLLATAGGVATVDPGLESRRLPDRQVAGAPSVLIAGDSVAGTLGDHAVLEPEAFGINPVNEAHLGCSLVAEDHIVRTKTGEEREDAACTSAIRKTLARERPDVVLLAFGGLPIGDVKLDGQWHHACDPPYRKVLAGKYRTLLQAAHEAGTVPVLTTVVHSTNPFRDPKANEYVDCVNEVIRAEVEADPKAVLVDLDAFVCPASGCRERIDGQVLRPDSVHFKGPGGRIVAQWYVADALARAGFS